MAAVVAGFLTAVPTGGRVGGLVKPLTRVVELAAVFGAVVLVVPGRRVVVVVVAGRFAVGVPSDLDPLDLVEDLGEDSVAPVPVVPAVSSPERTDSSCWTTSNPSASDMMQVFTGCGGLYQIYGIVSVACQTIQARDLNGSTNTASILLWVSFRGCRSRD